MRRILLILSLLFSSTLMVNAAHIIGGDFNVSWVSGNTFEAELKLFRDCFGGGAAFDPNITITIYDSNTDTIVGSFDMANPVITSIVLGDECYTPTSLCVEQGVYTANIDLPDNSGGYYLAWERCCRNAIVTNLMSPSDEGMVFVVTVADPALQNSTPQFDVYPPTGYFCIGPENVLNFNVTDADGDSLVYFFDYPLSGDATGPSGPTSTVAGPKPYSPCVWADGYSLDNILNSTIPMTIDQVTGDIVANPEELGVFVFAVYVAEFRNGVQIGAIRREIQFQTVVCTQDYPPAFTAPVDSIYEVVAENLFEIEVVVDDANASDPIFVEAGGELFNTTVGNNAHFEAGDGTGTITSLFSWQTECVNISNDLREVLLKAYSDGCSGSDTVYHHFFIKVIPDVEGHIENAPNVFTPNEDGINDAFSIDVDLNPCYDTFSVTIYDRWGKLVYESTDPEFRWYGKNMNSGADVTNGTYFYIINASFQGVPYRKTSNVSLFREKTR